MAQTETQTGTVAGFFDSESKAKTAMDELLEAGFTRNQIGLAVSSGTGTRDAIESGDRVDGATAENSVESKARGAGQTAEHAGVGMWDKVKDFFTGNEAEPYAGEQQEGSMGTREITDDPTSGSGYGAQGYGDGYDNTGYSDAVHHSLSGLSVPTERASYFGGRFGRGDQGAVLTVSAGSRMDEAEKILKRNGADLGDDDNTAPQTLSAGAAVQAGGNTVAADQQNIKLYGEVLRVHKDRISRGEVRLRKETITEMQTVQVPVTREELVIERVPVTGETLQAGADAFSDQEIRIPLSEERASVDKQAVLQEEIRVGKREVSSTESFDETVRHEQLKVDDETNRASGSNKY